MSSISTRRLHGAAIAGPTWRFRASNHPACQRHIERNWHSLWHIRRKRRIPRIFKTFSQEHGLKHPQRTAAAGEHRDAPQSGLHLSRSAGTVPGEDAGAQTLASAARAAARRHSPQSSQPGPITVSAALTTSRCRTQAEPAGRLTRDAWPNPAGSRVTPGYGRQTEHPARHAVGSRRRGSHRHTYRLFAPAVCNKTVTGTPGRVSTSPRSVSAGPVPAPMPRPGGRVGAVTRSWRRRVGSWRRQRTTPGWRPVVSPWEGSIAPALERSLPGCRCCL